MTRIKSLRTFFLPSQRKRWCKLHMSNSRGGYCLLGALNRLPYRKYGEAKKRLSSAIAEMYGPSGIAAFNDRSTTAYKDIVAVVRKARV